MFTQQPPYGENRQPESAMGHKRKWYHARAISVSSPKADICQRIEHVCFVPEADIKAVVRHDGLFATL
jgi:hypothetical protein